MSANNNAARTKSSASEDGSVTTAGTSPTRSQQPAKPPTPNSAADVASITSGGTRDGRKHRGALTPADIAKAQAAVPNTAATDGVHHTGDDGLHEEAVAFVSGATRYQWKTYRRNDVAQMSWGEWISRVEALTHAKPGQVQVLSATSDSEASSATLKAAVAAAAAAAAANEGDGEEASPTPMATSPLACGRVMLELVSDADENAPTPRQVVQRLMELSTGAPEQLSELGVASVVLCGAPPVHAVNVMGPRFAEFELERQMTLAQTPNRSADGTRRRERHNSVTNAGGGALIGPGPVFNFELPEFAPERPSEALLRRKKEITAAVKQSQHFVGMFDHDPSRRKSFERKNHLDMEISQTTFLEVLAEMSMEGKIDREVICSKDHYHDLPVNDYRHELYAAMFARNRIAIEKQLAKIPEKCSRMDAELRTLARGLLSDIAMVEEDCAVILSVRSVDQLEEFLSRCGKLAYESPEVAAVVTRLETLYKAALEDGTMNQTKLWATQSKGWIVNLMLKRSTAPLRDAVQYLDKVVTSARAQGNALPHFKELTLGAALLERMEALESQLEEALNLKNLIKLDDALQVTAELKYRGKLADDALVMRDTVAKLATGILFNMGEKARASDALELAKYNAQARSLGIEAPRVTQVELLLTRCHERCRAEGLLAQLGDFIELAEGEDDQVTSQEATEILPVVSSLENMNLTFEPNAVEMIRFVKKYLRRMGTQVSSEAELVELLSASSMSRGTGGNMEKLEAFLAGEGTKVWLFAVAMADERDSWVREASGTSTRERARMTRTSSTASLTHNESPLWVRQEGTEANPGAKWIEVQATLYPQTMTIDGLPGADGRTTNIHLPGGKIDAVSEAEAQRIAPQFPFMFSIREGRDLFLLDQGLLEEAQNQLKTLQAEAAEVEIGDLLADASLDEEALEEALSEVMGRVRRLELELHDESSGKARVALKQLQQAKAARMLEAALASRDEVQLKEAAEYAAKAKLNVNHQLYKQVTEMVNYSDVDLMIDNLSHAVSLELNTKAEGLLVELAAQPKLSPANMEAVVGLEIELKARRLHYTSCSVPIDMAKTNTELMTVLTKVRKQGLEPASVFLSSLWTDLMANSSFQLTKNSQQTANSSTSAIKGVGFADDGLGETATQAAQQNVGLLGDLMGGDTYALNKFNHLRPASEFASTAPKKKGQKEDPDAHLKWAAEPLKKSLTVPKAMLKEDKKTYDMTAVMAMQLVMEITCPKGATSERMKNVAGARTMGQQLVYDPRTHDSAQQLVKIGLYKADLRDELYLQVIKQLTENPYPAARVAGWLLMTLYLHSFPPSVELYVHIQSHLKSVLLPFEVREAKIDDELFDGNDDKSSWTSKGSILRVAKLCVLLVDKWPKCGMPNDLFKSLRPEPGLRMVGKLYQKTDIPVQIKLMTFDQLKVRSYLVENASPWSLISLVNSSLRARMAGGNEAKMAVWPGDKASSWSRTWRGFSLFVSTRTQYGDVVDYSKLPCYPPQAELNRQVEWGDDILWFQQLAMEQGVHDDLCFVVRRTAALRTEAFARELDPQVFDAPTYDTDIIGRKHLWMDW